MNQAKESCIYPILLRRQFFIAPKDSDARAPRASACVLYTGFPVNTMIAYAAAGRITQLSLITWMSTMVNRPFLANAAAIFSRNSLFTARISFAVR